MPPSTGHASATPDAPGSAETGFSFLVDLADMPASWWSAAENVDATRGRVFRDDGSTELAVDWIDYDHSANTGWIRFNDDAAASPRTYRIYPPVSGNATVAASATFGSDNAYDGSVAAYYPLDGDAVDRTSNSFDGTEEGAPTSGAAQVGDGYTFDGSTDAIDLGTRAWGLTTGYSLAAWVKTNSLAANSQIIAADKSLFPQNRNFQFRMTASGAVEFIRFDSGNAVVTQFNTSSTYDDNAWHFIVARFFGTGSEIRVDGAQDGSDSVSTNNNDSNIYTHMAARDSDDDGAADVEWLTGSIDEVHIHTDGRSADWWDYEYAQSNDNTLFWNGWTWNAPGGGAADDGAVMRRRYMMGAA